MEGEEREDGCEMDGGGGVNGKVFDRLGSSMFSKEGGG